MTIGQRLKELRGNLSQAKFGNMLFGINSGAAQAKIKRIEAGTQELTVSEAIRIADHFEVDLIWFLTGEKKSPIRQPSHDISVDNGGAMGVSSTAYKIKNTAVHNDIEYILNSDDNDAINALNFGINGVLKALGEKTESVQLLRQIASGQKEVVGLMRELSTVLAEESVPADTGANRGVRGKKTA